MELKNPSSLASAKSRRDLLDALSRLWSEVFQRRQKIRMCHARAQVGPAIRLMLNLHEFLTLDFRQLAARGAHETFHIELGLHANPAVEKAADLNVLFDRAFDLAGAAPLGQRLDHQRIKLSVLRLLHPVVSEQALELSVQVLVVLDAVPI